MNPFDRPLDEIHVEFLCASCMVAGSRTWLESGDGAARCVWCGSGARPAASKNEVVRRATPEADFGRDQATAARGGRWRCLGTNSGGSVAENGVKLCVPTVSTVHGEVGAAGEQAR
jgi:hypothetical protein